MSKMNTGTRGSTTVRIKPRVMVNDTCRKTGENDPVAISVIALLSKKDKQVSSRCGAG
jgi:hypothetical protein